MSFCTLGAQFYTHGFCAVDNKFITDYLPDAEGDHVRVYLFGMYVATQPDTAITGSAEMAEYLAMPESAIISAFEYWRNLGLVTITSTSPLCVVYNHPSSMDGKLRKFKAGRFTDFNEQLQALFPHRMITPNEYEKYYDFIDSTKIKDETLLMIAGYCVANKGDGIRSSYIITVAREWLNLGIRTPEQAEDKIKQAEACSESLREIARALGKKSVPDFEDRQTYLKWRDSWGFSDEVILHAAKLCKNKGGMSKLDAMLDSYFRMSLFSIGEIDEYNESRRKLLATAKEIVKRLGLWYDSYDYVIEKYVTPWLSKGFDSDALLLIAEQCFIKGTKTLEGMNSMVSKFLKEGCLTVSAIGEYLACMSERDKIITRVIAATGSSRAVTANDRDLYAVWSNDWGFSDDVIIYAASLAAGRVQAMSYTGNILARWKNAGATDIDSVKALPAQPALTHQKTTSECERTYTKQELDAFLGDIDDFEDIKV